MWHGLQTGTHPGQVVRGIDVDQHARIVKFQPQRGIARHQPARAFIAAEQHQFREQLGGKCHWMAAPAAVLRIDHRLLAQGLRHLRQAARLDQRHVSGQHQPAAGMRPRRHTRGDRITHAQLPGAGAADLGQHHHVATRHPTRCFSGQRSGGDHDHRQPALDGMAYGLAQYAARAQILGKLVRAADKAAAQACGQHNDNGG